MKAIASSNKISANSVKKVFRIKKVLITIDKLLKKSLVSDDKKLKKILVTQENEKRLKAEKTLEEKKYIETPKKSDIELPKTTIFDRLKNFITNIFLGYLSVRLIEHLPKIKSIVNLIANATEFILNVSGKLLDGLVTFIDWGYKAYDAGRGILKAVVGEDNSKKFDELSGHLNKFLNLAILAGLIAATSSSGSSGKKGPTSPKQKTSSPQKPKITTSGGKNLDSPIRNPLRKKPKVTTSGGQANRLDIRNPLRQRPKVTTGGGKTFGKNIGKIFGRGVGKRVPLIGGIIDFAISLALGEDPGRAAARAVGSTAGASLGGFVTGALGSVIPGAGTIVGGLIGSTLGGILGDIVAGSLYDSLVGGPKEKKNKGGIVKRGSKITINEDRKIADDSEKIRKLSFKLPSKTDFNPGIDVGGENKVLNTFPKTDDPKAVNPYGSVLEVGEILDNVDYFGPMLAVTTKMLLGQSPDQKDYDNVGLGVNLLINQSYKDALLTRNVKTSNATLNSNFYPNNFDVDITDWVSKRFKDVIRSDSQKVLSLIKENSTKRQLSQSDLDKQPDPTKDGDETPIGGKLTEGQWGPLLDLIAGKESGGNYEAMYPSTTLKGATKMTISEVARRATGAVGKYQQLPQYLVGRAKAAGLNPDKDLYSPENQEKIIINVNIANRGGKEWLNNKISDEQFMQRLSQEFASLPNAQGKFHYRGQRSSITPDKVKSALSKVKSGGYTQKEIAESKLKHDDSLKTGKGYGKEGSKIAGELGRFMKKKGIVPGQIHRHPEHPPYSRSSGHSKNSLHYQGRAIDLGAYAYEQGPILKAIAEFNRMKNVKPVELLHAKNEPRGHSDHVHVAYAKGGETLGYPHRAILGDGGGKEIVIDTDSSQYGPIKNMLLAINQENSYEGVVKAIRNYAPYESLSSDTIYIDEFNDIYDDYDYKKDQIIIQNTNYSEVDDMFETLNFTG